jgi:hypothetical protein
MAIEEDEEETVWFVSLVTSCYKRGIVRAIGQAVSRWLPTAAARVQTQV